MKTKAVNDTYADDTSGKYSVTYLLIVENACTIIEFPRAVSTRIPVLRDVRNFYIFRVIILLLYLLDE